MIRTDLIAPLGELLRRQADTRPEALAFADRTRRVTYGVLAERTGRLAVHLQAIGVGPGDRVAVFLPNSVAWVEACLAIVRAGGVAVPISRDATDDEILYRLSDAGCVAGFAEADQAPRLSILEEYAVIRIGDEGPDGFTAIAAGTSSPGARLEALREADDIEAPAFIVYTSGTTGKAKGVILSLRGMLWVTAACWAPITGLSAEDYVLNALPLYHSYALNFAVVSIVATGASEYIVERFSTSDVLALLDTERFTIFPGVPTTFHYLLNASKTRGTRVLGQVRLCLSAGAVLAGTLNRDFEDWFGVKLLDGYGITETSTMVTLNAPYGTRVMGSCGVPLPGLMARVVDRDDRDLDAGEEGELIVRGPNVCSAITTSPPRRRRR